MKSFSLFCTLSVLAALSTTEAQSISQVNASLGLERSQSAEVHIAGVRGEPIAVTVVVEGQLIDLELVPQSVLSDGFVLRAQGDDGVIRAVPHEEPATYRGTSNAFGGVTVAASWLDDGLHARLHTPTGEDLWLEPVPAGLTSNAFEHVFYSEADAPNSSGLCATDGQSIQVPMTPHSSAGSAGTEGSLDVAELGCDADFEYFSDYGTTTATMNRITSVINTMNLQYESQVEITHEITTILVRTSATQPYTSTNSNTLLNQFQDEWEDNQGGIQRDVAHLFSGKNISGGVIGIAFLGGVCNSFGYGVVESDFNPSFACATDLSAHEIGHNWNAGHCSCGGNTMNSFITCANSFATVSINSINNFKNSINCLSSQTSCTTSGATVTFNGGGTNPLCLNSLNSPVIGTTWQIELDASAFGGTTSTIVLGYNDSSSGTFIGAAGELLLDLGTNQIFNITVNGGGVNVHDVNIPNIPTLEGVTLTVQGGALAGSSLLQLCNAEEVTLGCMP